MEAGVIRRMPLENQVLPQAAKLQRPECHNPFRPFKQSLPTVLCRRSDMHSAAAVSPSET